MKQPLTVTIRLLVKSGMEEKFKQEYLSIIPFILNEEGCINYNLYQSKSEPSVFMLYENWVSQEDYARHLQMSYMKVVNEKADLFLAEPIEIDLWGKVF
ncbi:MAG: putative quinol monooxygenase [Xenococcaceae cyanobacterium MO_188.B32]|nr:putative quinol monooxygenase [Xenococcaceae cyanobacterium MO_188.B32]